MVEYIHWQIFLHKLDTHFLSVNENSCNSQPMGTKMKDFVKKKNYQFNLLHKSSNLKFIAYKKC